MVYIDPVIRHLIALVVLFCVKVSGVSENIALSIRRQREMVIRHRCYTALPSWHAHVMLWLPSQVCQMHFEKFRICFLISEREIAFLGMKMVWGKDTARQQILEVLLSVGLDQLIQTIRQIGMLLPSDVQICCHSFPYSGWGAG